MSKNKSNIGIPLYDGQKTLDVSKILVYDFYYDHMIPKWSKPAYLYSYWQSCTINKNRLFFEDINDVVEVKDYYLQEKSKKSY